jgi:hypothetical protein
MAKSKLSEYYSKTHKFHGTAYAVAAILDPRVKLSIFQRNSWLPEKDGINWYNHYRDAFQRIFEYYSQKFPIESQRHQKAPATKGLDDTFRASKRRRLHYQNITPQSHFNTELEDYLQSRTVPST